MSLGFQKETNPRNFGENGACSFKHLRHGNILAAKLRIKESLVQSLEGWQILEDFSASNYQYMGFAGMELSFDVHQAVVFPIRGMRRR